MGQLWISHDSCARIEIADDPTAASCPESSEMKPYLLVLILCGVTTGASAQVIHLVTGNNYHPYTDESLPKRGMVTEIVELAFKEMKYDPQITFRPWKRGYEEAKRGIFAGAFPYIKSEERLKDFYFSDPIYRTPIRIFVGSDSSIKKIEDLKGKRICIPLGYAVNKGLKKIIKDNIHNEGTNPSDLAGCLRMIQLGRKDFFIIDEHNGWMTIMETFHTKEHFRTLDDVFEEETHHLIVSKTYLRGEQIIDQFNQGLKKLKEKGFLKNIMNQHLKDLSEGP